MKLLFDQNISFRVIQPVDKYFPEAKQIHQLNLTNNTDKQIWEYARNNDYCIVTYDSDFYDLSILFGHPPKIIWLRLGNTSTKNLAEYLIQKQDIINEFINNAHYKDISCLEFDS